MRLGMMYSGAIICFLVLSNTRNHLWNYLICPTSSKLRRALPTLFFGNGRPVLGAIGSG